MKTFVVPDLHGHPESLRGLLVTAGLIDTDDKKTSLGSETQIVSIGDLFNAVRSDIGGDEETLELVHHFDVLILGNHEAPYIGLGRFGGYYEHPPLRVAYNGYVRSGLVQPAVLVGETLLTHAGVHEKFAFPTAKDAYDGIMEVWEAYPNWDWQDNFHFKPLIPKPLLIEGVGPRRGGSAPFGGILWCDWNEPKNSNFNQVFGHTPMTGGPTWGDLDHPTRFHLNIDCDAKHGSPPCGVWLNEDGSVDRTVRQNTKGTP